MIARTVEEIIDAAYKNTLYKLNLDNKGKDKYLKRMKRKGK